MKVIEGHGCTVKSVFPLRSEIIPKHFRLDTTSLVYLLFTNENRIAYVHFAIVSKVELYNYGHR
jgi:hypothetical protein